MNYPGQEAPIVDPASLMAETWSLWPIADDFEVEVTAPVESAAAHPFDLKDEITALWGTNPDPNRFFHGIFFQPWPPAPTAPQGGSTLFARAAVSGIPRPYVIPHEIGHNLGLEHSPGCDIPEQVDESYPYPNGGLGGTEAGTSTGDADDGSSVP